MIKNYWQFIFGLQHNANLFFNNKIDYLQIQHDWSMASHELFLVRDLKTSELFYDAIDGLVIGLYQQKFKKSLLCPFSILFKNNSLSEHPNFEFITDDYPVVLFKNYQKTLALLQIKEKLHSAPILPIGDPRDFWGITSSQSTSEKFALFTLIELNIEQQNNYLHFNQDLNYNIISNQITNKFLNHQFTGLIYPHFKMVNNLYLNWYDENNDPFLQHDINPAHIGLSLIQMLDKMKNSAHHNLMHPRNESSPFHNFNNQEHTLFNEYLDNLHSTFTLVVCYTANHMQYNEKINTSNLYLFNQNTINHDSTNINTEVSDNKPMTMLRAITSIFLFLIIIFCILYGFYWLINRFEFIKFSIMVLGLISFLYILSKR